jgi:hypothetical protein
MNYSDKELFVTKRYAMLYALLCRTNELDNKLSRALIEKSPTVSGFASFINKYISLVETITFFERESLQFIKPKCVSQAMLNMYFNEYFLDLKRMRMSNKYHSRLNAQKSGGKGFDPVEGFKTINLLNIAGLFNMKDLVFAPKSRDVQAFNWYLNNPNRILLDNGAFSIDYSREDFEKIIELYKNFSEKVKTLKYTHDTPIPQQRSILLTDIYSKIAVVGPDKPQNAKETVKLLKIYASILNQMVAQTDIMFAVQTTKFQDETTKVRYDIPDEDIVELIDTIKDFGRNLISALPSTKGFQRTRNRATIPFIVSLCEDRIGSFMSPDVFEATMNNLLQYTRCPIKVRKESASARKVIRFHLLGSSFGVMYMQTLFNICLSNFLVKEMNLQCTRPDDTHVKIFKGLTYKEKFMILGEEYHPEVFRHLVSCDSSSWIGAVMEKGNIYNPLTGRQMGLKKDDSRENQMSLTHSSNKELRVNIALLSSKIAESRYYDCSWETASGDQTLKDIEKSLSKIVTEVRMIRANPEEQKRIRLNFVKKLLKQTNAWVHST